jgi:hypothetical protein
VDTDFPPNQLLLEVVYHDEHLIQLECRVAVDGWSGVARAYSTQEALGNLADVLEQFGQALRPPADWEEGDDTGTGLIALRFYTIDRFGHVGCQVRLASVTPTEHRPEQVWRFAAEVSTEPGLVVAFAGQLKRVARELHGQAILDGIRN